MENRTSVIRKYVDLFNRDDEENVIQSVDNAHAAEFLENNIPLFLCPDPELEAVYYFRWWTFRKHIKDTPYGKIITEFHPPVSWAGPFNSIVCATGHHMAEGRWLKESRDLMGGYLSFWMEGRGNNLSYNNWMIDAAMGMAKVWNDDSLCVRYLREFNVFYREKERKSLTRYGLFWSYDDRDGMEYQISGSGLRPTLNSYMAANARALADIARRAGNSDLEETYTEKADETTKKIRELLWDPREGFFKTIPQKTPKDEIKTFDFRRIPIRNNVKEEIGYIPWQFGLALPEHARAWKYLTDEKVFKAPFGPRTADGSHPGYRATPVGHECLWDGPSWPYATTQTADSLIAHLQNHGEGIGKADFMDLITTYARSHHRVRKDGKRVFWLDENLDAETGDWISRTILENTGWRAEKGGRERGKDYNHSAFCDLVIRGIAGIIPEFGSKLKIAPLVPEGAWPYFLAEDIPYHGKSVTVAWDADGTRLEHGPGLSIWADGKCLARRETLGELEAELD